MDIPTEEKVEEKFDIHFESVFALSEELRNHAKQEAKYQRMAAIANKRVNKYTLVLKIVTAEIIDELRKQADKDGRPIASTAIGELRKAVVPGDPRYQQTYKKLYQAQETADVWNGLLSAWTSRGFRLQELTKIADRILWDEPRVFRNTFPEGTVAHESLEDKLDAAAQGLEY